MKKIKLSLKEYAKICLECPYKNCITTFRQCDRLKPYKCNENVHNEKDERIEEK